MRGTLHQCTPNEILDFGSEADIAVAFLLDQRVAVMQDTDAQHSAFATIDRIGPEFFGI